MKIDSELISIIVPVYNVEKYLRKCLNSIITQTYENLEIICIDDGSPDNSIDILNEFIKKDKRIKIIRQKNQGLSGARNTGISNATGKYIMFIDSDDWIEQNMVELMAKKMIGKNLDLVICGTYDDYFDRKCEINNLSEIKKYLQENINGISYFKIVSQKTNLFTAIACNKLYRLDLIKNKKIFFPEKKLYEDLFFTFRYLINSRYVDIVENPLYHYVRRKTSITNILNSKDLDDVLFTLRSLKNFLEEEEQYELLNSLEFKEYMFIWISRAILFKIIFLENKYNKKIVNKIIEKLKNDKNYKEYCQYILKNSANKKNKLFIRILYFNSNLLKLLLKINYYKYKFF